MTADTVQPDPPTSTTAPPPVEPSLHEQLTRWRVELHTFSASIEQEIAQVLETLAAISNRDKEAFSPAPTVEDAPSTTSPPASVEATSIESPAVLDDDVDEIDLPPARTSGKGEADPNRLTALKLRLSQQMATTEHPQPMAEPETTLEEGS